MTLISGPLSTVTTTPSAVSQVNVSINSPRTRGAGVMTPEVKTVTVTGGDFSSQIAPGSAVLSLLIGGRESAPIPILVGDVASQTLAEVVDAARLATGETQESLAQFVQQVLSARSDVLDAVAVFGQVEEDALTAIGVGVGKAEGAADRAEDAADRAEADADRAEADATQTGLDRTATGEDRQAAAQSATSAATHEDTSLDAAAAAIAAAVSVAQFQGNGFPNGKVTAPVGSIYTDLDATAGAIRWIKTTGTGNTGWRVECADTGLRQLSLSAITAGQILYRRRNEKCTLYFKEVVFPSNSGSRLSIPGSRPEVAMGVPAYNASVSRNSTLAMTMTLETHENHGIYPVVGGAAFDSMITWDTTADWRPTLPGTPA